VKPDQIPQENEKELQNERYTYMSKAIPDIVHFVASKKELMRSYMAKYQALSDSSEKQMMNQIFEEFADDDTNLQEILTEAEEKSIPFIEQCCKSFLEKYSQNISIYDKIKTDISRKISLEFQNLIVSFEEKLLSIKNDIQNMIQNSLKDEDEEKEDEDEEKEDEEQDQPKLGQDNAVTLQNFVKYYEDALKFFNQEFQTILTALHEWLKKAEQSNLSHLSFQAELINIFNNGLNKYIKIRDEYINKFSPETMPKLKSPTLPKKRFIGDILIRFLIIDSWIATAESILKDHCTTSGIIIGMAGSFLKELSIAFDLKTQIPDVETKLTSNNDKPSYKLIKVFPDAKTEKTAKAMALNLMNNKAMYDWLASGLTRDMEKISRERMETSELMISIVPMMENLSHQVLDGTLKKKLEELAEKVSKVLD